MSLAYMSQVTDMLDKKFSIIDCADGNISAWFQDWSFGDLRISIEEAVEYECDFAVPLFADLHVMNRKETEILVQSVFLCDAPLMLDNEHFLIEGCEIIVPPAIEKTTNGTWRTRGIAEIIGERFMDALVEALDTLEKRISVTEWEDLIPEEVFYHRPTIAAISSLFEDSPMEELEYYESANDCVWWFDEEDTEPRYLDIEDTNEYTVDQHEASIEVGVPDALVYSTVSQCSFCKN